MLEHLASAGGLAGDAAVAAGDRGRRPDLGPEAGAGLANRRREPRYAAIENQVWMQWWQDGELLGRSARLVNVSRHGALIVAWVLLREPQALWIYLEEPAPQIGVEARVVGVVEAIKGMHQIRLQFLTPCPDFFFDAAVNGFEAWLSGKARSS